MAEILIKAIDATHPDPVVDLAGCYKRGDPVVVMPDGHSWGSEEGLPKFYILKITGVTPEQVNRFIESYMEDDGQGNMVTRRRRKFRIDVDDVPLVIRNQLRDTGTVTVTWTQVRNYVRNKITDQTEAGTDL